MAKFFDSLVEQSVSHPVRIAAERRDGLLDPDEPGALVLHAVVAGAVARVPRPERVERRHPEHPEPDLCDTKAGAWVRARARPIGAEDGQGVGLPPSISHRDRPWRTSRCAPKRGAQHARTVDSRLVSTPHCTPTAPAAFGHTAKRVPDVMPTSKGRERRKI